MSLSPHKWSATATRRAILLTILLGIVGGIAGWGPLLHAQSVDGGGPADTISVDDAIRDALAENPTIEAVEQGRSAAAASVREARSEWFPVVEGQAQYRRLSGNVDYTVDLPSIPGSASESVTFAPAILNRYTARVSVEQPVFTGFRVPNRLEAAQAQTQAAEARLEQTKNNVVYDVRRAYWKLYEAQVQAQAAGEALSQMERQLTDVRNRKAVGRTTETDVLRVRARRDQVRVEQIQARNAVQSARQTLNDHRGVPLDTPVVLADTVVIDSVGRDAPKLVAQARQQRSDLEVLRENVRARTAERDIAQSGWFPQLSLTGSYLYARPNEQLFPPEDQFEGTWEAGVRLSWRLSVGGETDAATDRAHARRLEARYQLLEQRRAVTVEVKQQAQNVKQAREAVRASETSVRSAQEAYRAAKSQYDEGMVVVSEVLDAERALRQARARLAETQANYALARAAMDRALGRPID